MAETQPMMLQELCYTAADFRLQLNSLVCDEGVADMADGSLLVTTGGAGLDLFVAEGAAFINSDSADQGMYSVYNDASVTVTATTADGTNPRIDQVIATVNDSQISGTDDDWVLSVLAGTPTVGATLANLTGAAALPDRSIRLAYVLVPASFAGPFVNATHILDARTQYVSCGASATDPYVALVASAATSIGASTKVNLATTEHIDDEWFSVSASVVTVLKAGKYDLNGSLQIAAGAGRVGVGFGKNGTTVFVTQPSLSTGAAGTTSGWNPTAFMVSLAAGETIQLVGLSSGGSISSAHDAATGQVSRLVVRKVG